MKTPSALTLCLAAGFSSLQAGSLASDNFDSPDVQVSRESVTSVLEWKTKNPNFTLGVDEDAEGLKSGKVLRVSMPFHYGGLFTAFPETILNPGQTLKISLRFRFTQPPPAVSNAFRLGLFNSSSGDPADGSAPGYWVMLNPGAAANDATVQFEAGSDGKMGGGDDMSPLGSNAASFEAGIEPHTLVLAVTRGGSGVEVSWQIDGESQSREDAESRITTFNGFAIAAGDLSQTDLLVDDVTIELEP